MPHWTKQSTQAHTDFTGALKIVDSLLSFMKGGKGKPSSDERALFAAAVVFIYGTWENFAEQLAIELAKKVSKEIEANNIPARVRNALEKKPPWELAVAPGWRDLWVEEVQLALLR